MIGLLLLPTALAGYGDVEAGYPSPEERSMHLWTNAARVAPWDFESAYSRGGCSYESFTSSEQKAQALLYYDRSLNEAARYHSQDMSDNGWFDHDSSDGTPFDQRLGRFYTEGWPIGENIYWGNSSMVDAVMSGWMCSSGHRSNIMSPDYNELGTGAVTVYYTQDFGNGTLEVTPPVAMAAHEPEDTTDDGTVWLDWSDDAPPAALSVVIDGEALDAELAYGEPEHGIYMRDVEPEGADCHAYFVRWETAAGEAGTFPGSGSYLYGTDCGGALWTGEQAGSGGSGGSSGGSSSGGESGGIGGGIGDGSGRDDDDDDGGGCATAAPLGPAAVLLSLVLLGGRRPTPRRDTV